MSKNNYRKYIILIVIVIAAVVAIAVFINSNQGVGEVVETIMTDEGDEIKVTEDGTRYIVDPDDILSGGPPKDGIPSIDNPKFVSVDEADAWIKDEALVLALDYEGTKRVYPVQILTWHEIVNEKINGKRILITYCPLCGSGIAYDPIVNGKEVEFGTSGKLYNSNLVMYDRLTDTYWTQIGGKAIIGELSGQELEAISIDTVTWGEWKIAHPDSEVLSTDTGFVRDYTSDTGPYANYFADDFYLFPGVENQDSERKLQNKEFVFGIEVDGVFKAYAKKDVEAKGTIKDTVNGVDITINRDEAGIVTITRDDTGEEIVKEVDFWFAWFAFHPETELYGFE